MFDGINNVSTLVFNITLKKTIVYAVPAHASTVAASPASFASTVVENAFFTVKREAALRTRGFACVRCRRMIAPDTLKPSLLRAACIALVVSVLMVPLLRIVGLRVFSMASEGYAAGTHSAAFVTCPNEQVAKEIARYEWQGKIEEDSEVLMMIKTRTSKVPALAEYVRSVHPYEVAEVISLPIDQGNPPYLKWLGDSVPE
ncbi:protein CutA homolog isoform X2 [Acipenser ruthenus]|uniref:protein CutA homolog isoform X2 n=1 Tax=Acipenser ruthenus TaxID=7906 RepID=UPI0027429400|nr:protein CutA homolog isoform X2 [Acipenser ruthenus]